MIISSVDLFAIIILHQLPELLHFVGLGTMLDPSVCKGNQVYLLLACYLTTS
jgi:hypothetical protein